MTAQRHEAHPAGPGRVLPDTQQGMRRRNLARVMHAVSAEGPLSRAAVSSRIGLTRAAVSTLVDEEPYAPGCWRSWARSGPGGWDAPARRSRSADAAPPASAPRSASTISRSALSTCAARCVREPYGIARTVAAPRSR